jgi:hypothetical protein
MLTPADFIFNEQSTSQYVEFNYTPMTFSNRYASYHITEYLLKMSDESSTLSSKKNIDNSHNNFESFNITFAENAIKELNSATSSRAFADDESLLFPGVRHLSPGIILFERPPCHKIVSTYNTYRDSIESTTTTSEYYLPIPWQVYIAMYNPEDMRLVAVKMFFTNNSLTSLDQPIYSPPLYNFYSNGTLCRPFFSSMEDIEKYPKDLSGIIASAYDWIWNSGFNFDITESISFFLHSRKYEQFDKYLNPQSNRNIEWLRDNHLHSIPNNLPSQWHIPFFKSWEQVPLTEVSKLSWNPFTDTEFYYQHINNVRDNLTHEFCDSCDYVIHEDSNEEECHGDYCPENCVYLHEIHELESYQIFVSKHILSQNRTLTQALDSSVKFLTMNKINVKPLVYVQCKKMFSNILKNSLSTS